jgi:hypothetical protein
MSYITYIVIIMSFRQTISSINYGKSGNVLCEQKCCNLCIQHMYTHKLKLFWFQNNTFLFPKLPFLFCIVLHVRT